jgi:putative PIN family toxin of toxin-antitoxin system
MNDKDKDEFIILLEQIAEPVNISEYPSSGICRDPADEPYLQTALAGRADYIVSGDGDLLDLKQFENIGILSPSECDRLLAGVA